MPIVGRIIVILKKHTPQALIDQIYADIAAGNIETWIVDDSDKFNDFTHWTKDKQFLHKAYIRPVAKAAHAEFRLLPPPNKANLPDGLAGVYLGRFAEMLIGHYRTDLKAVDISPEG